MQEVTKRDKQVFWMFGVFERLAHLGYLQDPPYHIVEEKIDFFLEIDSYCQLLFDSDKEFDSLVKLVCKDAGVVDPEQVASITQLARDYKDNRDVLVKFALSHNFS
jgi:hypothetical protein